MWPLVEISIIRRQFQEPGACPQVNDEDWHLRQKVSVPGDQLGLLGYKLASGTRVEEMLIQSWDSLRAPSIAYKCAPPRRPGPHNSHLSYSLISRQQGAAKIINNQGPRGQSSTSPSRLLTKATNLNYESGSWFQMFSIWGCLPVIVVVKFLKSPDNKVYSNKHFEGSCELLSQNI